MERLARRPVERRVVQWKSEGYLKGTIYRWVHRVAQPTVRDGGGGGGGSERERKEKEHEFGVCVSIPKTLLPMVKDLASSLTL